MQHPHEALTRRVNARLDEMYTRHLTLFHDEVESYYTPGLGYYKPIRTDPDFESFSIAITTLDGETHTVGDEDCEFALQSISKVFSYGRALEIHGRERVLSRVGVEPSGDDFNSISLVFDERRNRPYNPMVNAGALVTTDLIRGDSPQSDIAGVLEILAQFSGNDQLAVDEEVFQREMETADRNRAISYLMRSLGMIGPDVEDNLALYLRHCSVTVTVRDLAMMAATLANGGVNPATGVQAIEGEYVRDILSVMYMCGMYNAAGEWAYSIGIPAKSGVSGAIMAVVPGKLGIAVYSPGLDEFGTSVRGAKVCKEFSSRLGLHAFAGEEEDTLLAPQDEIGPIPPGTEYPLDV